jgi:hypothetical protein
VTSYADEQAIQSIIEQSPDLLPGISGTRAAVARELALEAGYVDLVGIDADGAITLVECKLKANPEIRRHVVGQVLAYAAALWGRSYEEFDQAFSARTGQPLAKAVAELASDAWDEETFRASVATNLEAGRFRLVIAVDEITDELGRIVRYLNDHTSPELQILALELRYVADAGVEILMPSVYGTESVQRKLSSPGGERWTEASFFASLAAACTPGGLQAARRLYDYAKSCGATLLWGSGLLPSVSARMMVAGKPINIFSLYEWPKGKGIFAINFEYLQPYLSPEALTGLAARLRTIPGVAERFQGLEESGFKRRPSLPFDSTLALPETCEVIIEALDEILQPGL